MGSRFEDMADGTLSALNATEVLEPVAQAEPAEVLPAVPAAVLAPAVEQPIAPADVLPTPAVSAPTPLAAAPLPAVPALAVQPAPQAIVAAEPESDAPALSRRPAQKNPELAEKVAKRQEQEQAARAQKRAAEWVTASKAPKGNAQRNNTKGSQSGSNKKAKATQSGKTAKPAAQAGDAADFAGGETAHSRQRHSGDFLFRLVRRGAGQRFCVAQFRLGGVGPCGCRDDPQSRAVSAPARRGAAAVYDPHKRPVV